MIFSSAGSDAASVGLQAMPKSARYAGLPAEGRRMLLGLTSRWRMSWEWTHDRALAMSRRMETSFGAEGREGEARREARVCGKKGKTRIKDEGGRVNVSSRGTMLS